MSEVNYFGPFNGDIGYAIAARNYVRGLGGAGVDVMAIPDARLSREEDMKAIKNWLPNPDTIDPDAIALLHSVPRGLEMAQFHGRKRFCLSVLEVDKIPQEWVDNLNKIDGAFTATKWGKKVYEDCGVKKVTVVPHGVDSLKFSPFNSKLPQMVSSDAFKFLAVGKFEHRKGYDLLMKAFSEEFTEDDNVELFAHMDNPFIRDFNVYEALVSLNLKTYKRIHPLPAALPSNILSSLYASVDCFVSPTRGEGWGLPITEAMAAGLPTIATNWSGPTEYMTKKNSYPLKITGLVDVPQNNMFSSTLACGQYAEPDYDELRALMRHVYDNRDEAEQIGEKAREDMIDKWSWETAGEKMKKALGV